jgi:hypothetical protein
MVPPFVVTRGATRLLLLGKLDHADRVRGVRVVRVVDEFDLARSDMMWYDPSARYSRMIVYVPSACRYRSSV